MARKATHVVQATSAAHRDIISGSILVASCMLLMALFPSVTDLFDRPHVGNAPARLLLPAFLLNLALVLFSWRRYRDIKQLERTQASEQAEEKRANVTGLPGLHAFEQKVGTWIDQCDYSSGAEVVMLALDVDHYGLVIDVHGKEMADRLLRRIGEALIEISPPQAMVAHMGADEFAIAFKCQAGNRQKLLSAVRQLTQQIDWTFSIADCPLHVTCSIGAVSTLDETLAYEELRRRSQMAMRFAMRRGHGNCVWFDFDMDIELRSRSAVEEAMRIGIPADEFQPYFERQVDLATGRLVGFEVLARWQHEMFGSIPAERFIQVAEKSGMIGDLSHSVIKSALLEARNWNPEITLSVNISPIQMEDRWLAQKLLGLLVETGFPAARLEVEITESALCEDFDLARELLASLKNQGIRLALDDFGTGYSSLQHLRSLPFDRLKIDKSFIQTIDQSAKSRAIAGSIVSLADGLGLPVTAEGVETPEILARLREMGCEKGQGWYFGRPMPAEEARRIAMPPLRLVERIELAVGNRLAG